MDYVALLNFRSNLTVEQRDGALMRRAGWQYPSSIHAIAEYWPSSDKPAVVFIFSTDQPGAMMELQLEWGDVFEITILPAMSAEDGLKIGPDVMGSLTRLKQ